VDALRSLGCQAVSFSPRTKGNVEPIQACEAIAMAVLCLSHNVRLMGVLGSVQGGPGQRLSLQLTRPEVRCIPSVIAGDLETTYHFAGIPT
jgi:hypothetical protein